ncbi:MAG TPA: hypothetical protein VM577_14180 [Anaerovoracaceae bacterium]|nr:hypothetical protein [Anaerovoracaceae bacterium]
MVKKNLSYDLAQAMDNVLNDEEYQKIFKVQTKVASKSEEKKEVALDNVQAAFDALLEVSAELDELGLSKSAGLALKAAHSIVSEAHEDDPLGSVMKDWKPLHHDDSRANPTLFLMPADMEVEEPAKMEEDEDLKGLLEELGDENEVMDVPSDEEKKEGNPESC